MRVRWAPVWSLILFASSLAGAAEPKFEYSKPPEKEPEGVVWKVQAKAGLILTTGNSTSTSLAAGVTASRTSHGNRFTGEGSMSYVRAAVLTADDANGSGFIDPDEVARVDQTTSQAWAVRGRYDRFFGDPNSVYISGRAASDVPAGKELMGGGQVGYSRRLYKTDASETSLEAGYDLLYESYVAVTKSTAIHSARAAMLHSTKIREGTLVTAELEALVNLNPETAPNPKGGDTVAPLDDWRVNANASLTSALTERISFGFTFRLLYDHVPAPRPPFAIPFAAGFRPFADRLDTYSEASLIITLL